MLSKLWGWLLSAFGLGPVKEVEQEKTGYVKSGFVKEQYVKTKKL